MISIVTASITTTNDRKVILNLSPGDHTAIRYEIGLLTALILMEDLSQIITDNYRRTLIHGLPQSPESNRRTPEGNS